MILRALIGMAVGIIRELGGIKYTQSVIYALPTKAALVSFGIGLLDFFIIGALAWNHYVDMALGFIFGGALCSYMVLLYDKRRKKNSLY